MVYKLVLPISHMLRGHVLPMLVSDGVTDDLAIRSHGVYMLI
jgi:hypothetical protein